MLELFADFYLEIIQNKILLHISQLHALYSFVRCYSNTCVVPLSFLEDILSIFRVAKKDNSRTLTVKKIKDALKNIERYPQVALYLKTKQMKDFLNLLKGSEGDVVKESVELDIERFKKDLSQVNSQVKFSLR